MQSGLCGRFIVPENLTGTAIEIGPAVEVLVEVVVAEDGGEFIGESPRLGSFAKLLVGRCLRTWPICVKLDQFVIKLAGPPLRKVETVNGGVGVPLPS